MCFVCMIITSEQRVREWERDLNNGHIIFIRVRLLVSECQINWSIFIPYDCVIIMLYRNMEMGWYRVRQICAWMRQIQRKNTTARKHWWSAGARLKPSQTCEHYRIFFSSRYNATEMSNEHSPSQHIPYANVATTNGVRLIVFRCSHVMTFPFYCCLHPNPCEKCMKWIIEMSTDLPFSPLSNKIPMFINCNNWIHNTSVNHSVDDASSVSVQCRSIKMCNNCQ